MSNVADIQTRLGLDEWVEWLWERDEAFHPVTKVPVSPMHRFQHIQLMRDGVMKHFVHDMGLSMLHPKWQPLNFPAFGYYKVGEVLEIADGLRENRPPEDDEPIDIAQSYLNLIEEKAKRKRRASTFGAYLTKVR